MTKILDDFTDHHRNCLKPSPTPKLCGGNHDLYPGVIVAELLTRDGPAPVVEYDWFQVPDLPPRLNPHLIHSHP